MKRLMTARIPPAITLTLAWLAITAALLTVGLWTLRSQLIGMMASQTRDSASLMAATVATHVHEQNALYIRTLLKAIAESGDYAEVTFTSANNWESGQRIPRYLPDVPVWFQQLVTIAAPVAEAEVRTGWDLAGHIAVSRQPSAGYRLLWRAAVVVSGLSLAGLAIALRWQARMQARHAHQQRERESLIRELEYTLTLLKKRAEPAPQISQAEARARFIGPLRLPRPVEEVDH